MAPHTLPGELDAESLAAWPTTLRIASYVRPKLHEAPVAADAIDRKGTAVATRVATRHPKLTETG
jgi:hypothetical protein